VERGQWVAPRLEPGAHHRVGADPPADATRDQRVRKASPRNSVREPLQRAAETGPSMARVVYPVADVAVDDVVEVGDETAGQDPAGTGPEKDDRAGSRGHLGLDHEPSDLCQLRNRAVTAAALAEAVAWAIERNHVDATTSQEDEERRIQGAIGAVAMVEHDAWGHGIAAEDLEVEMSPTPGEALVLSQLADRGDEPVLSPREPREFGNGTDETAGPHVS